MASVPFPGDVTTPAGRALLTLDRMLTDPGAVPDTIGRFTRLVPLGERGTVSTYRGFDVDDGEPSLVRVFEVDGINPDDKTSSLELEVALTLEHPHLLPIREAGDIGDVHLAILDVPDGPSYRERLARRGAVRWPEAVSVTLAVARALEVYHGHHVIHRGVRPSDIYLLPTGVALGPPETPPLSNIAIELGPTGRGVVIYAAPEVIRNDDVGPAADLYALGLTLRELLSGIPVIVARDLSRAVRQALGPLPAVTAEPDWPPGLATLAGRLTAHHPGDRPACAGEVVAELLGLSDPAPGGGGGGRVGSRHRGRVAPAGSATGSGPTRGPASTAPTTAPPQRAGGPALGPRTSGQTGEIRVYRRELRSTDPTLGGTAPPTGWGARRPPARGVTAKLATLGRIALVVLVCAGLFRACASLGGPASGLLDRISSDGIRGGWEQDRSLPGSDG